jgi:hypothetical protein
MGSFLSVTKASHESPVFLEMVYSPHNAPDLKPVALVGKPVNCFREIEQQPISAQFSAQFLRK